jgi:hypothetical protein
MKHIDKIFFVVILLAASHLCLGTEPNDSPDVNAISLMERITALEQRIADLEDRISQIETRRPTPAPMNPNITPGSPVDPNKDAIRIERSKKTTKEAYDLIALNETRLKNLAGHYSSSSEDQLNRVMDELELLNDIERSYKTIMRYAAANPELGIDHMKIEKKLIELTGKIKTAENKREDLKESFYRTHKRFTRSKGY